jgi:succinate dehydrogenase hydrophobic anchor subunit
MISHIHQGASESFWVSSVLIFVAFLYLHGWLGVRSQDHGKCSACDRKYGMGLFLSSPRNSIRDALL